MKLSSTILASSLASAALIGSAAEVPPHGGPGGNPFKKKDIEPRAVTTAWSKCFARPSVCVVLRRC